MLWGKLTTSVVSERRPIAGTLTVNYPVRPDVVEPPISQFERTIWKSETPAVTIDFR